VVTSTKIDESLPSEVALRATDLAGNVTNCDPVLTTLALTTGRRVQQTFTDIPREEHFVTIQNGSPGLKRVEIRVNGKLFEVDSLRANQLRTIDIAGAMVAGRKNTITLVGHGVPGDSAMVLIADSGNASRGKPLPMGNVDSQRGPTTMSNTSNSGTWGHVVEHQEYASDDR
jgi:hypothetical protein